MKFADLHLHTVFSDGTSPPAELIQEAKTAGLEAISVVDHDSVDGITESLEAGRKNNLEVLSGIELTAEYDNLEIHILGYLIDHHHKILAEKLKFLKEARIERIYKILDRLKNIGITLKAESVFALTGRGTVGRLHVARALIKEGWVNSVQEAFKNYIGDKCPAYVLGFRLSPSEAIKLIREVGGIPVLAHPYTLNRDELIPLFVGYGLRGIEAYYSEHAPGVVKSYLSLAKKYNLLVTGGSDYHGEAKPEVKIGLVKVPYKLVEKLKEEKRESLKMKPVRNNILTG